MTAREGYDEKTKEELILELEARDEVIEVFTGATADEIASWFKLKGRADDLPLLLKKQARVTLEPIQYEVSLMHPQPRGWPDDVIGKVMDKLMPKIDERIVELLFGRRAMAHRAKEREVSIRKRTRPRLPAEA
jgi:hypothetical protein